MTTPPLHRHQLLRLGGDGWTHALRSAGDDEARGCLALWAERDHPLVVTRQSQASDGRIAVGLPAPAMFGRRRLALAIEPWHVASVDAFPPGDAASALLAPATRDAWQSLLGALADAGCAPCVYGGHGWQCITGLDYLHAGSDLDLLLPVPDAASADAVCAALQRSPIASPRLDGELVFADGGDAIAWREWLGWREGRSARVLVKRLRDVALIDPAARSTC